jgi:DNA repair protein RadC
MNSRKSALEQLQAWAIDKGFEKLSETDLVSLVLSDPDVAQKVMDYFGGWRGIANQPLEEFLQFKGLGEAKIIRLAAVFEIARRIVHQVLEDYEPPQLP